MVINNAYGMDAETGEVDMQRILIIDDEKEIVDVLRDYFSEDGFEVQCCYDGAAGLVGFDKFQPHLVILDIMLPYIDGTDILRTIRGKSQVPILMLSAKKSDHDKIRSLGLGADEYIEKPFSPKVVVAQAKAILRRSGHKAEDIGVASSLLRIKNVEIDTAARTVKVVGGYVELSPKEYDLLVYFLKNTNRVFTKEQLLEAIWGVEDYIDPNTVTVHVRKIREKIEKNPAEPELLKTVWGVGYQLFRG